MRKLGGLAALGSTIFTVTWIVLGIVSDGYQMWDIVVDGYSSIAQPISGLGLGSTAPVMNTAFVLGGVLVSVGTWAGMSRWPGAGRRSVTWTRGLVTTCGIGMAVCGIFTLESILLHTFGFVLATAAPGIGFLIGARTLRGTPYRRLAAWLWFAGPVALAGLVAFMATFNATDAGDNTGVAGLIQRILVTVVLSAVSAIGLIGSGRPRRLPTGTATAGVGSR
jgi:hypothetical protein